MSFWGVGRCGRRTRATPNIVKAIKNCRCAEDCDGQIAPQEVGHGPQR